MSVREEGMFGEAEGRKWLLSWGYKVFQPDWIAFDGKDYFTVEVKHQEMFESPPFDGHGLPLWEVKARIDFQNALNVRAILLVLDKVNRQWYWQYLDILEQGEYYDTKGKQPRRVYPVANFYFGEQGYSKK